MKHVLFIISIFFGLSSWAQTNETQSSEEDKASDTKVKVELNSAKPVYTPELGDTYQWQYENQTQYNGSLDMMYNQYFLLNNSLRSQGQNLTQLQNNQDLSSLAVGSLSSFPNTFETNFIQYVHAGENTESGIHLLNAYELNPNRSEIYDELLEYAEWTSNETLSVEAASKIKASNKYDNAIYDYSEQLLNNLPQNSYLITSGELETITSKVIQLVEGKQASITVIRKKWLEEGRYSKERLSELGLTISDLSGDLQPLIQKLITSNPGKNFYLSLTLPLSDFDYMLDRLYLTGLTYKYSEIPIQNLNMISENWVSYNNISEQVYANSEWGKKLISNYLLSGIKLFQYYQDTGDNRKAKKLKEKLLAIARTCNQENDVKSLF